MPCKAAAGSSEHLKLVVGAAAGSTPCLSARQERVQILLSLLSGRETGTSSALEEIVMRFSMVKEKSSILKM